MDENSGFYLNPDSMILSRIPNVILEIKLFMRKLT